MPFGKRMGTPMTVAALTPLVMDELARVARLGVGRAVFLVRNSRPLEHVRTPGSRHAAPPPHPAASRRIP